MSSIYHHTEEIHNLVSPREIVPLVLPRVKVTSVLDVGCGTGTWLKVFEENGVTDYAGVDGDHLDKNLLKIPEGKFQTKDLRNSFNLQRKFDLALSLEVAEHLDKKYADQHVKTLADHSNVILFSAAIPGQGGQNHLNEQWPEYWQKKFEVHGFYFHDVIRPLIWNNEKVEWWYKQNIFLVTKEKPSNSSGILSLVHPALYERTTRTQHQYLESLIQGKQGLMISVKIFLNAIVYKIRSLFGVK